MAVSRPLPSPGDRQPRDEPRPAVGGAGRPENERRGERGRGGSSAVPSVRFRSGLDPVPFPPESFPGSPLSVRVLLTRSPPRAEGSVGVVSDRASLVGLVPAAHRPGAAGRAPCRAATPHATSVSCSPQRPPPRGSARTPSSGLHPASSSRPPPPPGPTVAAACAPGPPLAPRPPGPHAFPPGVRLNPPSLAPVCSRLPPPRAVAGLPGPLASSPPVPGTGRAV